MSRHIQRGDIQRGDIGGGYSPAEPIGWREEHNLLARFILWVRGIEHCNDHEGYRRWRPWR
jgi:hypothetical protein